MVQFSKLIVDENGKLVETQIKQADPRCCPHLIMIGDHYDENGSCRCNDATHTEMKEWGYRWSKKLSQWVE